MHFFPTAHPRFFQISPVGLLIDLVSPKIEKCYFPRIFAQIHDLREIAWKLVRANFSTKKGPSKEVTLRIASGGVHRLRFNCIILIYCFRGGSKPQNRTKFGGKTEKPLKKSTKTENRNWNLADITREYIFRLTLIFDDPPVILLIFKGSENNSWSIWWCRNDPNL